MISSKTMKKLQFKNRVNLYLLISYFQQILFLTFGFNFDWRSTLQFQVDLSNKVNPFDISNGATFFPPRFFLDTPAYIISSHLNNLFGFNFHRFIHMSIYFLLTLIVIKYCEDQIDTRILKYWLVFPLFNFFAAFQHQHDGFVAICSVLLIKKFYNTFDKKTIFFTVSLLVFFTLHKPIFIFFYFIIIFSKIELFKKLLLVISGLVNITFYIFIFQIVGFNGVKINVIEVTRKVLNYGGFGNRPFFELIGYNFNPFYTKYLTISIFIFFVATISIFFRNNKINLEQSFVYYLLTFFIFSPTLATQNIAVIFVALSFFKNTNYLFNKYIFKIIEIYTTLYVIFYNIGRPPKDSIYLLSIVYNYFISPGNLFLLHLIPDEQYMSNFVAIAIIFLFIKLYEDLLPVKNNNS